MTAIRHHDGRRPRSIFIMLTIAAARLSRRSNTRVQRVRLISDDDDRGNDNARRRRDVHGDVDASHRCGRLSGRSNTRVQRVRLISDDDNRGKDNARHDVCGNDNAVTVSNPMPRRNIIQYSTIQVGFGCWEV
jgi:hypothetical protein